MRGTEELKQWGFYDASNDALGFDSMYYYFWCFLIYYFPYCIFYYSVYYIRWDVIQKNDYLCYIKNELDSDRGIKAVKKYGLFPFLCVYFVGHFAFSTLYSSISFVMFYNNYLSIAYILLLSYTLIKRSGIYYIDHFPKKYEAHLQQYDKLGTKYDPLKMRKSQRKID